MFMAKHC